MGTVPELKFGRDETAGTNRQVGAVGLQSVYRWRNFRKNPGVGDSMGTKLTHPTDLATLREVL